MTEASFFQNGVMFSTIEEFNAYLAIGALAADLHNIHDLPVKDITNALISLTTRWAYVQARIKPTLPGQDHNEKALEEILHQVREAFKAAEKDPLLPQILPN